MGKAVSNPILRLIRQVVEDPGVRDASDRDLLQRFSEQRDAAAFHALLRRHGPMVFDVCRGVLCNEANAEDAFQATFLILARKAASIRKAASVGSWLHSVAYRTALQARAQEATRRKSEARAPARQMSEADDLTWQEVRAVLHEELNKLPERYRVALVMCYLESKTQDQAAAQIGLAKSTLKERLERGRQLLRARLVRRGLGSAALLIVAAWPAPIALACLPSTLVSSTVKAAGLSVVGQATAGVISAKVAALSEGVIRTMLLTKLKITTAVLLIAGLLGGASFACLNLSETPVEAAPAEANERVVPDPAPRAEKQPKEVIGNATLATTNLKGPPRRVSVGGRVTDLAGKAIPGATVYLREQPIRWSSRDWHASETKNLAHSQTDHQGRFTFKDIVFPGPVVLLADPFPLDIIVVATGYGLAWKHVEVANLANPVQITLLQEGQLQGRLVDSEEKPISQARVRVVQISSLGQLARPDVAAQAFPDLRDPGHLDLSWSRVPLSTETNAQGRFVLKRLPREVCVALRITHDRFLPQEIYAATTDKPQPKLIDGFRPGKNDQSLRQDSVHTGPFTATLKPACRLQGQVVFEDTGKPAAGAGWAWQVIPAEQSTDSEGRVVLKLPPGKHMFWIFPPDNADYLGFLTQVDIKADQRELEHLVKLRRGAIVTGQVVDEETGKGIPGVEINYVSASTEFRIPSLFAAKVRSQPDGSFRLAVPLGKGRLVIAGKVSRYLTPIWSGSLNDVGRPFVRELEVAAGKPIAGVRLPLGRGLVANGRATDPEGKPVPSAEIHIRRSLHNSSIDDTGSPSGADGKFTVSGFGPEESVEVVVVHTKRRLAGCFTLSVPPDKDKPKPEEFDVVLQPMASISGHIKDEKKQPVSGALIRLLLSNGNAYSAIDEPVLTDAAGKFSFPSLVPGTTYMVQVEAEGFVGDTSSPFEAKPAQNPPLPDLTLVKADQSISGVIVDPAGKPIGGLRVHATSDLAATRFRSAIRVTDLEGRFHLTQLPRGEMKLCVVVPGIPERTFPLAEIEAGKKDVRIEFDVRQP